MTDKFDTNSILTDVSSAAEPVCEQDIVRLWRWVNSWLKDSVLDLDKMIVTAPAELKSKFAGYSAMETAIEIMVQQAWASIAKRRLNAA